ncbi:MAG: hypothetical protein JXD21_00200 [Candidatus Omnitrophica bacterium]|nr:hypothetical protein [Candidatus Omnitrophota bacterium]
MRHGHLINSIVRITIILGMFGNISFIAYPTTFEEQSDWTINCFLHETGGDFEAAKNMWQAEHDAATGNQSGGGGSNQSQGQQQEEQMYQFTGQSTQNPQQQSPVMTASQAGDAAYGQALEMYMQQHGVDPSDPTAQAYATAAASQAYMNYAQEHPESVPWVQDENGNLINLDSIAHSLRVAAVENGALTDPAAAYVTDSQGNQVHIYDYSVHVQNQIAAAYSQGELPLSGIMETLENPEGLSPTALGLQIFNTAEYRDAFEVATGEQLPQAINIDVSFDAFGEVQIIQLSAQQVLARGYSVETVADVFGYDVASVEVTPEESQDIFVVEREIDGQDVLLGVDPGTGDVVGFYSEAGEFTSLTPPPQATTTAAVTSGIPSAAGGATINCAVETIQQLTAEYYHDLDPYDPYTYYDSIPDEDEIAGEITRIYAEELGEDFTPDIGIPVRMDVVAMALSNFGVPTFYTEDADFEALTAADGFQGIIHQDIPDSDIDHFVAVEVEDGIIHPINNPETDITDATQNQWTGAIIGIVPQQPYSYPEDGDVPDEDSFPILPDAIVYSLSSEGAITPILQLSDGGQTPIVGIMQGQWAILGTDNGVLLFVDIADVNLDETDLELPSSSAALIDSVEIVPESEPIEVFQISGMDAGEAVSVGALNGGDSITIYGFTGEYALIDAEQGLVVPMEDILPSLAPMIQDMQDQIYGNQPIVYSLTEDDEGLYLTEQSGINAELLVNMGYVENGQGEVFVVAADPQNLEEEYYIPLGSVPMGSDLLNPGSGPMLYPIDQETTVYGADGVSIGSFSNLTGISGNENGVVVIPNGPWLDIVTTNDETYRIPGVPTSTLPETATLYVTTAPDDEGITLDSLYEVTSNTADTMALYGSDVFVLGDGFTEIQGVAFVAVSPLTDPESIYFVPVASMTDSLIPDSGDDVEPVNASIVNSDYAQVYAPTYVAAIDYFLSLTFNTTSDDPRISGFQAEGVSGTFDILSYNGDFLTIGDAGAGSVDRIIEMIVNDTQSYVHDYQMVYDSIDPSMRTRISNDMETYGLAEQYPEVYSFVTGEFFNDYSGLDNPQFIGDSIVMDIPIVLNAINAIALEQGDTETPIYAMSFDVGMGLDIPDTIANDFDIEEGVNFYGLTEDAAIANLEENYGIPEPITNMLFSNFSAVPIVVGLNIEMFNYDSEDETFTPVLSAEEAQWFSSLPPVITGYEPIEGYTLDVGESVSFDTFMVGNAENSLDRTIMVQINEDLDLWVNVGATNASYDDVRNLMGIEEGHGGLIGVVEGAFEHITDIGDVVIGSIVLDAGVLFGDENMQFVGGEMLVNSVWFQHLNDVAGWDIDGSSWAETMWGIEISENQVAWQDYFDSYNLFTLTNDMALYGYENGDPTMIAAADTMGFLRIAADIYAFNAAARIGGMVIGGSQVGQLNTVRGLTAWAVTQGGPTVMMAPMYADMGAQAADIIGSIFDGEFDAQDFVSLNNIAMFVVADAGVNTFIHRGSFTNRNDAFNSFTRTAGRSLIIIGTAAAGEMAFDNSLLGAAGGMGGYGAYNNYATIEQAIMGQINASGSNRVIVVMGDPDIALGEPLATQIVIRGDAQDRVVNRLSDVAERIGLANPDLDVTVINWQDRAQVRDILNNLPRGERATIIFIGHGDIQMLPENIGQPITGITVRNAARWNPDRLLDYNDWVNPRAFIQEFTDLGVNSRTVERFCIASCGVAYPHGQPDALPGTENQTYLHQVALAFPRIQFEGPNHIASFGSIIDQALMIYSADIMQGLQVDGAGRVIKITSPFDHPIMPR